MTSPDGGIPDGQYTFPVNTGETYADGAAWYSDQTESDWRSLIRGPVVSSWNGALEKIILLPLSNLLAWIVGGEPEDWDTLEELRDNLIPALIRLPLRILGQLFSTGSAAELDSTTANTLLGSIPIIGDVAKVVQGITTGVSGVLATAAGLVGIRWAQVDSHESQITAVTSQVSYVQQIIHVDSGRPLYEGVDPTGDSSISVEAVDDSVALSATLARWAFIRMRTAVEKATVSFMASKTGTVTGFWADLYRLEADGSVTLVHSSADLSAGLTNVNSWMQEGFSSPIAVDIGDVYAVQFSMTGAGTVTLPGKVMPDAVALPGFRPKHIGASRNPTGDRAPSTIATVTVDGMYNATVPYAQLGMDLGQLDMPRFFYDDFNRSGIGANWILSRDGGATANLRVYDSRLAYGNATDGAAYGLWIQPLLTDRSRVEATFSLTKYTPSMLLMHCTYDRASSVRLYVLDTAVQIRRGTTIVASAPGSGGNAGTWALEFDDTDSTYRVYRNGSVTPTVSWPDPTNTVGRGDGHRYAGVGMTRLAGSDSAIIDNWIGWDC